MIRTQWLGLLVLLNTIALAAAAGAAAPMNLWQVAHSRADSHRFLTLFTTRQVTEDLANDTLIDEPIEWCKSMGCLYPTQQSAKATEGNLRSGRIKSHSFAR